ncbi:hypothetical protein Q7P35_000890 [Cladosporium inversicolor]
MNSSLPSSVCGSASDTSYTSTDQASIRSSSHTSITSTSTSTTKPKRTVRFQDPDPAPTEPLAVHLGPNLSLSSLELSSDDGSYTRHSRHSSSAASSIAAGKQPMRGSSPRFSRPLSMGRPPIRREASVSSTASAPGELEFTEWLARMEESRSRPNPLKNGRAASARGSRAPTEEGDKEERKKKKRSWVNLLVR